MNCVVMRPLVVLASIVFGLGCAAAPAEELATPAAPAERPALKPGDYWKWTSYAERFLREEGEFLVLDVTTPRGYRATRYRTRDLNLVKDIVVQEGESVTNVRDPHSGYLLFPLRVGASWSHSYRHIPLSGNTMRKARYEVTGHERITLRGRSYDAYRIEGIDQRGDRPYGIRVTFWYSPEVNNWVKFLGIDDSTKKVIPGLDFELVRYEPAK